MLPGARIPVSVIVVTRNEERNIERCLAPLSAFSEIVVVDSQSTDATAEIAQKCGARVVDFAWNGQYPKKRQWCLDTLELKHSWVFFVDADEVVTRDLIAETGRLFSTKPQHDGYFVRGIYIWRGKMLRHGLCNNKLCLFDRTQIKFPVTDDLDVPGMGEIEGHYQPVLKDQGSIGRLQSGLLHYAAEDEAAWEKRHQRYAAWEIGMNRKNAWPRDPDPQRQKMKEVFRCLPCRGPVAFLHSYILKKGFLDGAAGFDFARSRWRYYRMIKGVS